MIGCDLGSNTFSVVEIDCKTKSRIRNFEKIVKTAENMTKTGKISQQAVDRIVDAILEAGNIFDLTKAKAVATAAFRNAINKEDVVSQIYKRSKLHIDVISPKEEASYVRKAISGYLEGKSYVIMDLGGASMELIFEDFDKSFDIGIVSLSEKYVLKDLKEGIKAELFDLKKYIDNLKKVDIFVATAGTPTTIASFLKGMDYINYDYKKINKTILTIKDIDFAFDKLINMNKKERTRWVGVGRDDLIISGILIFKEVVKMFGFYEVLVIDDGVKEGVALTQCE